MTNSLVLGLKDVISGPTLVPPRIVLYGVPGIGKTSFGASIPGAIFLPVEDGANQAGPARFPRLRSFAEAFEAIDSLKAETHEFSTLVVDTLDALEPLVWKAVCDHAAKENIEAFGYGKGYVAAVDAWRGFLAALDGLIEAKGLAVVLLAHSHIKRFESPEVEAFDRYMMRLHEKSAAAVCDWADAVFFANYRVHTVQSEKTKQVRGVGTGERVMFTSERPAYVAKNRYGLPHEMPLSWEAFAAALTPIQPQATTPQ